SEVGQIIGIDKGAISKNIRDLIDLEFVTYVDFDENRRKKHLMLTDRGYQLHDEILPIALERENILLSGLKEWEIHFMFEVLNKMLPNLKEL
ncbi:MAG: MarR family winged helix-turn-helix transcriptional regulator, partial [Chloroflexota bacterium]